MRRLCCAARPANSPEPGFRRVTGLSRVLNVINRVDLPQGTRRLVAMPVLAVRGTHSAMPAIVEGCSRHFDLYRRFERVALLCNIRKTNHLEEVVPHGPKLIPVVVAWNLGHDAASPRARASSRELNVPIGVVRLFLDEPRPACEHVDVLLGFSAPFAPVRLCDGRRSPTPQDSVTVTGSGVAVCSEVSTF